MEGVNAWLHASSLPRPLKRRIRAFYADVWVRHAADGGAAERFGELPPPLRQEVAWELNRRLLQRLPLFRWGSRAALLASRRSHPHVLLPSRWAVCVYSHPPCLPAGT